MVSLSDSMVSSSARALPIRMRPDLSARKQQYLGQSYWIIKEPIGLNYFRFQEEEYAILQMLDGHTSLDEIKERFEAEFPPQKITLEELQQFLGMLHRSSLVIADVAGQGQQLRKRRDDRRRKEILGACSNILCIRFKGFDPERFLEKFHPYIRWFFSPAMVALCFLSCLAAVSLVIVEFETFQSKLPDFYQFFSLKNAFLLAITLGVTKVMHEFGHGFMCKHFGGECHEMGVMILVLTPCLYCNVSDSWMLPSKWRRAAIGAAGIYVEVVLASLATFFWWFSEPGIWNMLALNVMFIASVTTIVFNANPLLRYDGYYIMADLVEIPNLRQKATSILSRKLAHLCLGLEPPEDPFLPQRNQIFFALYSVAAAFYRWFVLASIMYFMFQIFKPYRLEILGHMIVAMSMIGLVVMPLYKVGKFFYVPGRIDKVKKPRMYISMAVIATVIAAIVYVPLPHSVICVFEVEPRAAHGIESGGASSEGARPVYVEVTGGARLEEISVKPGDIVKKGDLLARLSNVEVELEITRIENQRNELKKQLDILHATSRYDRQAIGDIPRIEQLLIAAEKQLIEKEEDREKLELRAPIAGTVLPPPAKPDKGAPEGQLPTWSGTPLDPKNKGCFLEQRELFCRIGDPKLMQVNLVIDQTDVELIQEMIVQDIQPKIEIKLDALPHDTLYSQIEGQISRGTMEFSSQRLSSKGGGELPTTTDEGMGAERPQSISYEAYAPLDNPDDILQIGMLGRAKVHTRPLSLGQRLSRFISHTFRFKL